MAQQVLDADAGDIALGAVTAGGVVTITADTGAIQDGGDDVALNVAASGLITLTAANGIGGVSPAGASIDTDGKIELAADSQVAANTTSAGDIF